jgi:AraC-like DNA-binding protein
MNRNLPIDINESLEENVKYHSVGFSLIPYIIEYNFERNDFMPLHWHEELQISWVYEGELDFLIDGNSVTLDEMEILFINRKKFHSSSAMKNDAKTLCLNFSLDFLHPKILDDYILPILQNPSFTYFKLPMSNKFSKYFHTILDEIPKNSNKLVKESTSNNYFHTVNLINQIMEEIVYQFEENNYSLAESPDFDYLNKLLSYIHHNYHQKITIIELTKYAHVSKTFCNQLFKKYTKLSPINYVKMYRLQMAQELLISTNYSITRISEMCGFSTISYFIECFRLNYKMSPLKFRQRFQN